MNIQLHEVRKESRNRVYESKENNEKRVPADTEYVTTENKISLIKPWKKGTLIVCDSMFVVTEQKHISGNRNVKVRIFPGATTLSRCTTT